MQRKTNTVDEEDVMADLINLGEKTVTGEYGYTMGDDGSVIIELWNDDFHGTKKTYRVQIQLEERTDD